MRTIKQAFSIGVELIGNREAKLFLSHATGYSVPTTNTARIMNASGGGKRASRFNI
jgi:hypothetical protein